MHSQDRRLKWVGLQPTGDFADLTAYTSRRRKVVWFLKSPPKKPPTDRQRFQRLRFKTAAHAWRGLQQETRDAWNYACRRLSLYLHGYNLWIHWQTRRDISAIRTIERQSKTTLLPL